tara:strand:- start:7107 stop:7844 length:738 start_codon:yes stop_codon:yes gene_type:complete
MCGLIGFNGKTNANPKRIKYLMKSNEARGKHSCGYYDGHKLKKAIGLTVNLKNDLKSLKTRLFIGHTRHKTHGDITTSNQHPFHYGKYVGAHNGVVLNYEEVGAKFGFNRTSVDSQMIFQILNHTNDYKILGLFNNTLATLYTKDNNRLYAYRKGNPLFCGNINGNKYFSSLRKPLEIIGCKNIFMLDEGYLYIYENGQRIVKTKIQYKPIQEHEYEVKNWWEYDTPKTKPLATSGWSLTQGKLF